MVPPRVPFLLFFPWGEEGQSRADQPDEGQSETDERLLERALAGDEASFERLVRRYHGPLARFLRVFVTDPLKAEDAAQETWIALFTSGEGFEGRSSFKTWLFRVGANRARDLSRKEGRDEARVREWTRFAEQEYEGIPAARFLPKTHGEYPEHWGDLPRPPVNPARHGPDSRVMQREAAQLIVQELERLPAAMAATVTLRDFAGVSAEETSSLLQVSESHQRVLLHRGRLRLWQVWERYQAGEE